MQRLAKKTLPIPLLVIYFIVMSESRTTYVLLGFLTWRPMSGYDLKRSIARSVGNFWSEGDGQIYPVLQRMADKGWIISRADDGEGGRRKRIHEITETGRAVLQEWLSAPVDEPPPRIEILLKLFFGDEVASEVSLTHVEAARTTAIYKLNQLQSIAEDLRVRREDDPRAVFWIMTVDYGLAVTEARLRWCDRAMDELRRLPGGKRNNRRSISSQETASGT